MANNRQTYRMSFTTGGALKNEMLTAARLFGDLGEWKAAQQAVFQNNLFQLNTLNSQRKIWNEVRGRLQELSEFERKLYVSSSLQQQGYFIWLTLCRRYLFIGEFAVSVITPKFHSLDMQINPLDYYRFWEGKLRERPELESIASSTQKRLRSGLFLFMRSTGIVNKKMEISPVFISSDLYKNLKVNSPDELFFFPLAGILEE